METTIARSAPTNISLWIGRILSTIIVLGLALDGVMKVMHSNTAVQMLTELGYPESALVPIGIALLISVVLYAVPQVSWIGAILLTGYLGGAIASHVRTGENVKLVVPLALGVLVWLALALRHRLSPVHCD